MLRIHSCSANGSILPAVLRSEESWLPDASAFLPAWGGWLKAKPHPSILEMLSSIADTKYRN